MCQLSRSGHRWVANVRPGETLKASKREAPRKTRSPVLTNEGSWKTTRSIGRACTAGNCFSRPVLTAKRLTALIPPSGSMAYAKKKVANTFPLPVDIQGFPGDLTRVATPVPIPNTAVKHSGPMVVLQARE